MKSLGRTPRFLGALLVIAVAAAAGFHFWSEARRHTLLLASVPPRPDLAGWAPELGARIESAGKRIAADRDAVAALDELSRLYHANGFLPEAERCYRGLEALGVDEPRQAYRHAMILSGFGESETARKLLREALYRDPGYTPARVRLGEILLKNGEAKEAAGAFNAALAVAPDTLHALLGLARCEMENRNWEAARAHLERITASDNHALANDLIVTVYEQLGLDERAAAIRRQMKASDAFREMPDPWMDELLGSCYDPYRLSLAAGAAKRVGDIATARRQLERAVALAPDTAQLRFQLAVILVTLKEYSKAREHLARCTELAPDFPDGWAHLSGLLMTVGDGAGSDRVLAEGIAWCPDSYGLHMMRAQRLKSAGRMDEAEQDLKTAIRVRPTEADPFIALAVLLIGQNRIAEGVRQFERALVAEPDHPVALSSLAFHAIETGDAPAARAWFQRIRRQPRVSEAERKALEERFRGQFGAAP